jgi:ubiquitin-like 1-activating enzyme E1 B
VVINALDNEEARKHVNATCFELGIPLIDAGTNGYTATSISICKNVTPCYQCVERKTDQSFPMCTIRSKPEKLIHCIVWAKALFEGIYGPKEQANDVTGDIVKEFEDIKQISDTFAFCQLLFERVYN